MSALLACCASHPTTAARPAVPTPAAPPPGTLHVTVPPAWDDPVRVDETRWIAGGVRFEGEADQVRVAEEVLSDPIVAARRTEHGWVFASEHGHGWRADTFLGALEPLGRAAAGVSLRPLPSDGPLLLLGSDRQLYATDGAAPLAPFDALRDYGIVRARFDDALHGHAVEVGGLALSTSDGGRSWQVAGPADEVEPTPVSDEDAEERPRPLDATLDRVLADLLHRFPGWSPERGEIDDQLRRVGQHWLRVRLDPERGMRVSLLDPSRVADVSPDPDCDVMPTGLATCPDGIRRLDPLTRRWERVPGTSHARMDRSRAAVSVDGSFVLFWSSCRGRPGLACRIPLDGGPAEEIAVALPTVHRTLGVTERELVLQTSEGAVVRIDLSSGRAREQVIFPDDADHVGLTLLPDGTLMGVRHGASPGSAEAILIAGGRRTSLSLPDGTYQVAMMDAGHGVAAALEGLSYWTADGGARWTRITEAHVVDLVTCERDVCRTGGVRVHRGRPGATARVAPSVLYHPPPALVCVEDDGVAPPASGSARIVRRDDGRAQLEVEWRGPSGLLRASTPLEWARDETGAAAWIGGSSQLALVSVCADECTTYLASPGGVRRLPEAHSPTLTVATPDGGLILATSEPASVLRLDGAGRLAALARSPYADPGLAFLSGQPGTIYLPADQPVGWSLLAGSARVSVVLPSGARRALAVTRAMLHRPCTPADAERMPDLIAAAWPAPAVVFDGQIALWRPMSIVRMGPEGEGCLAGIAPREEVVPPDVPGLWATPGGSLEGLLATPDDPSVLVTCRAALDAEVQAIIDRSRRIER